jgi:hypothetical protein
VVSTISRQLPCWGGGEGRSPIPRHGGSWWVIVGATSRTGAGNAARLAAWSGRAGGLSESNCRETGFAMAMSSPVVSSPRGSDGAILPRRGGREKDRTRQRGAFLGSFRSSLLSTWTMSQARPTPARAVVSECRRIACDGRHRHGATTAATARHAGDNVSRPRHAD